MRTINFSEARSNLKKVLDNVASDHSITIVTRRDAEDAVIMSLRDYNSLQETLHLFGNPSNAERLHAAMAEAEVALPAGARILGPQESGAPLRTGDAVSIRKVPKKTTRGGVVKGMSHSAAVHRDNQFVNDKAASSAGKGLAQRKSGAKGSIKSKTPEVTKRISKQARKS